MDIGIVFMLLIAASLFLTAIGWGTVELIRGIVEERRVETAAPEASPEPTVWEYEEWEKVLADPEGVFGNA